MKKIIKIISTPLLYLLEWLLVPKNSKRKVRDAFETLFVALFLAMVIRSYVIQAFFIPSGSMENTLLEGDHLIANKTKYIFTNPKRHDILIFQYPEDKEYPEPADAFIKLAGGIYWDRNSHNRLWRFHYYMPKDFIKRCIGLPGDIIEIKEKKVYINNEPEEFDGYRHADSFNNLLRDYFGPAIIPGKDITYVLSDINIYEVFLLKKYLEVYNKELTFDYSVFINDTQRSQVMLKSGQRLNFADLSIFDLITSYQLLTIKYNENVNIVFDNFKINGQNIDYYTFKEDTYFTLGDNRDNSSDSRFWGVVPASLVNGTALFNYWPVHRIKLIR